MNETNSWIGTTTGTATINTSGYSGNIGITTGHPTHPLSVSGMTITPGLQLSGNSTINYSTNQFQNKMTPKQVNVAVFTITRDKDTNEINSTKFRKELWIEQKNGTSIDLLVAKQLFGEYDPELTIIKVLATVSF